jgi:predicted dehydrogenase
MEIDATKRSEGRPVGIGVIGIGGRISEVIKKLPGLGETIEVVAMCDPAPTSIERAKTWAPDATVYEDHEALVRDPAVDWVFIGSWNCFHREHAVAALEAGKHVFCEKPLATSLEDCLAIRRAHEAAGTHFCLGFTLRYSPHYRAIREILEAGEIGRIVSFEFNETLEFNHGAFIHGDWRRKTEWAGSHLLEKCCHDIDLANWMVGARPRRVASFGGCDFFTPEHRHLRETIGPHPESGRPAFEIWDTCPIADDPFGTDKDIVDNQVVILEYPGPVRATFHTNCATAIPERRMYICGTEGTLRADVIKGSIELRRFGWGPIEQRDASASGSHGGGDQVLAPSLAGSMLNDAPDFATLEMGLDSAVTVFAVDEALRTGRVVEVE